MNPESLDKLKKKLQAIDEAVTMQELSQAIDALLTFAKKLETKTQADLESIAEYVKNALERVKNMADENYSKSEEKMLSKLENTLNQIYLEHESMMAECDKKMSEMKDGEDGEDADEELIVEKVIPLVLEQIPAPEIPDYSEDIDDLKLEIKKVDDKITNIRTAPIFGPSRGVFLKVNGVKQGLVSELNIVGSGVAITKVNGLPTITITGGSGSGSTAVETPTGTVNGANTSFTVVNQPLYIIVDGISKFSSLHYTYLAGTITITDGAPPTQFIRSVYSV